MKSGVRHARNNTIAQTPKVSSATAPATIVALSAPQITVSFAMNIPIRTTAAEVRPISPTVLVNAARASFGITRSSTPRRIARGVRTQMAYAYVRLHMPLVRVLYLITTMNPKFLKFLGVALTWHDANALRRISASGSRPRVSMISPARAATLHLRYDANILATSQSKRMNKMWN